MFKKAIKRHIPVSLPSKDVSRQVLEGFNIAIVFPHCRDFAQSQYTISEVREGNTLCMKQAGLFPSNRRRRRRACTLLLRFSDQFANLSLKM